MFRIVKSHTLSSFRGILVSRSSLPKNVVQLNAKDGGTTVLPSGGICVPVGALYHLGTVESAPVPL